jgi:hypothetical protein
VYLSRYIDLLWTFYDPSALYNTIFKIVFISTSAYTVYLMLNDFKPTHDPNLDTFKVQYLLAASTVLAVLFPYKYTLTEVSRYAELDRAGLTEYTDPMGVFHLAGISRYLAPTFHAAEDW